MILIREVHDPFASSKHVHWMQQVEADDIDGLIATMSEALEAEGIVKPRSYEAIEVQVVRRVVVEREVQQHVVVNVAEAEEEVK